jgi:hypothetical protein
MSTHDICKLKPGTPVIIKDGKSAVYYIDQVEYTSCRNTHPCRVRLRDSFHHLVIAAPEEISLTGGHS